MVGLWLESTIYGFYLCLFCISLYVQFYMSKTQGTHGKVMFGAGILMFFISTGHMSLTAYQTIYGYVDAPGGPIGFVGNTHAWHSVLGATLYATQGILGDTVAIYRCWIVWGRNYKLVALPLVLLIVSIISGYTVTVYLSTGPTGETIFNERLNKWIKVFYAVAVIQNTMTTSLMAYRLWSVEKASEDYRLYRSSFLPIARILIESAALYLAVEIVLLSVYCAHSNAQYIVNDLIPPVVGITFSAIAIRVTWRSHQDHITLTAGSKASTDFHATIGHIPMQRIAVNITRDTEVDGLDNSSTDQIPPEKVNNEVV